MDMNNLPELLANAVLYGTAVVGGASLILQGVAAITKITPSTRDDEIVSKAQAVIVKLQRILDRVALNPAASKARQD